MKKPTLFGLSFFSLISIGASIFRLIPISLDYLALLAGIVSLLTIVSFVIAPGHKLSSSPRTRTIAQPQSDGLPRVPRTVQEILTTMSHEEFEIFSAAVIIGMGQGHKFSRHTGGSGDRGVDVMLHNMLNFPVAVQCKHYAVDNIVGPDYLREFAGTMRLHQVSYGFFVTTSSFSEGAQYVIRTSPQAIHAIDGQQLESLIRLRSREIALAWQEIRDALAK